MASIVANVGKGLQGSYMIFEEEDKPSKKDGRGI